MDKQQFAHSAQVLEIALGIVQPTDKFEKYKPSQISFLSQAYSIFQSNTDLIPSQITDLNSFAHFISYKPSIYLELIKKLKTDSGEEKTKDLETNSIPSELESMVALYKEHQANLLDTETPNSVAETVKRVRKAWGEREKQRLVYENASKERQNLLDEQKEKFYSQSINTKQGNSESITKNLRNLASYSLTVEIGEENLRKLSKNDYNEAIERIVYAAETGSVDVTNTNNLHAVSALVAKDLLNQQSELDEIDNLVQEQLKQQEADYYSDEADKYNERIDQVEKKATKELEEKNQEYQKRFDKNDDRDILKDQAVEDVESIITNLSKAIPNAKLQFESENLDKKTEELEKLIRKLDPTALNINPTGLGARTSAVLKETGGNKNINSTVVDLYSKGLTQEKLKELEKKPEIVNLYKKAPGLQEYIHRGINTIQKSKLGDEINGELPKMGKISEFSSHLPSGVQKILHPVDTAKSYLNKKIGQIAGKQIIKNSSSAIGKKFGNFILEHGLKEGSKKFAGAVAKKLIVAGAKQLGIQGAKLAGIAAADGAIAAAALALGIPTAGLSLIIGAVLVVVQVGWEVMTYGFNKIRQQFISDAEWKQFKKDAWKGLLVGGAILGGTALTAGRGIKMFGFATRAAAISAIGIIWLSIATIAVFLSLTYLVAPILTTLVQFDSVEKVKYGNLTDNTPSNKDCAWPLESGYQVIEGPLGGTHSLSSLQAIDLWASNIDGKPILSSTDGVVISAGVYSNYGNTVQIETTNSAGTFKVLYGHMTSMLVTPDQKVKQGDKIGTVGGTGGWSPHLHFEYQGIKYNDCPAGGIRIPENCVDFAACGSVTTGGGVSTI